MTDEIPSDGYVRRPRATAGGPRPLDEPGVVLPETTRQLSETGVRWDPAQVGIDTIPASTTERASARFRASLPDLIWNTARFEGNSFTLPEVQTLLDGVSVGGHRIEEQDQIVALSDAYSTLDRLVRDGSFALTKAVSDRLHLLVASREAIESGHFRGEGRVTGGGNVRLSTGGIVGGIPAGEAGSALIARFDSVCSFVDGLDDPRERALAYFAAATRSQFYFDGNKRTARLMMTGVLLSTGFEAVNIPYSRQYEFNVALDRLFETDDATRLMAFVADCG